MTVKQFKDWLATVPDEAIIEINHYSWQPVKARDIRATFTSSPTLTMDAVCNVEEVSA